MAGTGGTRPGAGRPKLTDAERLKRADLKDELKKLLYARVYGHGWQEVKRNGVTKTRIEHLLDVLYEMGKTKKNIHAIKEYYDRMLGKSKERLDITTKGDKITGIEITEVKKDITK